MSDMESPAGSVSRGEPGPSSEAAGLRCPKCGEVNSETARFCQQCAASLIESSPVSRAVAGQDLRTDRIVTAVACEVSTTAMPGDQREPASNSHLDRARAIFERHGGRAVDLPDSPGALVALFGPHSSRGDGTLRAVRAAEEIRASVSYPGARDSADVLVRLGVGTCELTSEDPNAGAQSTKRAVELAFRLQRAARPGEVIVAEEVNRLVGDEVTVEPVDRRARLEAGETWEPLRLVSVASVEPVAPSIEQVATHVEPVAMPMEPVGTPIEPVEPPEPADTVDALEPAPGPPVPSAPPGPGMAPLLGRDDERAQLREAFERTVSGPKAELVAVIGEAGVGKTRLVEDLLGGLRGEASVIRVRCRPGSEGGTTWPLADLVEQATAVADSDTPDAVSSKIKALFEAEEDDSPIIRWMAHQVGLGGESTSPEQTVWAVRRLIEALSGRGPLVLFFDDADRADPGLLCLLRDVVEQVRDLRVLLIVTGAVMPSGAPESDEADVLTEIRLEVLGEQEIGALADHVLGGEVEPDVCAVVAKVSAGNPLVAEQMLAMLVEEDLVRSELGRWSSTTDLSAPPTPPSIETVVEARLRGLSFEEAAVVGLAAVVGETFPGVRLAGLLPESARAATGDHLDSLARKGLIRPVADSEDTFGFAHALIREVAAPSVSDETTAGVHERYARWLEQTAGDRVHRYAEILGTHLESAARLRIELGIEEPETRELVEGATSLLAMAGARAAELGDSDAAYSLYDRAVALAPADGRERRDLLFEMARALVDLGEPRAEAVLAKAIDAARSSADLTMEWSARVLSATIKARAATDLEELEAARVAAGKAFDVFRDLGDDEGLAWAWSLQSYLQRRRGRIAAATAAAEWAAEHARRAGNARAERAAVADVAWAILYGPSSAEEAMGRCRELLDRLRGRFPAEQEVASALALLEARRGRMEEARTLVAGAAQTLRELGFDRGAAVALVRSGLVEFLAGDPARAEHAMREALQLVGSGGEGRVLGQAAAFLADMLAERGQTKEALELAQASERAAPLDDHVAQVGWRTARAKALAQLEQRAEADALARAAVQFAEQTDSSELRGEALLSLAQVLRLNGRANEALPFAVKSLRVFQRRGATVAASRAQALLDRVRAPASTSSTSPSTAAPSPSTAAPPAPPVTSSPGPAAQHDPAPPRAGSTPAPEPAPQPGGDRYSFPEPSRNA